MNLGYIVLPSTENKTEIVASEDIASGKLIGKLKTGDAKQAIFAVRWAQT